MISVLNSFDRSKVSIATVNRDTFDFSYNFYPKIFKDDQDGFF